MPVFCPELPPVIHLQTPPVLVITQDFKATAADVSQDFATQVTIFRNGVQAYYGPTKLTADSLEVHRAKEECYAIAKGRVLLIDPSGNIQADNLRFSWKKDAQSAHMENVVIKIGTSIVRASSADGVPGNWTIKDFAATSCPERIPHYQVKVRELDITPGKSGRAYRPSLELFGRKIVTLPVYKFNLDQRVIGLNPPSLSYRKDNGFGVVWDGGILLKEDMGLTFNVSSFPKALPGYGVQVAKSWVPADKSNVLIAPRNDLAERFTLGYFENVFVPHGKAEFSNLSTPRKSFSVGTYFNQGASGLGTTEAFTKPFDIAYEIGGPSKYIGYLTQIRWQSIREQAGPLTSRIVLANTVAAPPILIGRDIALITRADSQYIVGAGSYGWARVSQGIAYEPFPFFRVGAALVGTLEGGTPQFSIDQPFSRNGLNLRADGNLGSMRFSYLTKYDRDRKWFDREYMVSQAVGCTEAYVMYRKEPNDYRIGLRLRLDSILDVFQQRNFTRKEAPKTYVLSTPLLAPGKKPTMTTIDSRRSAPLDKTP